MNNLLLELKSIFIGFSFKDIIDILIVTIIFFKIIKFFHNSRVAQLFKGIFVLFIVYGVSYIIHLDTLSFIIRSVFQYGIIILIIVLTPEIRSAIEKLGTSKFFDISNLFENVDEEENEQLAIASTISIICDACADMAKTKTGALFAFEKKSNLSDIIKTGIVIDAEPSKELIENIFFVNTPLHDGSIVVRKGSIFAAGCYLPLSSNMDISKKYGTRHRAGLGLSESCDAICVIVSEERGTIAVALDGELIDDVSRDNLQKYLEKNLLKNKKKKRA